MLTVRFPVDEGYRAKPGGGWKRKVRRPLWSLRPFCFVRGGILGQVRVIDDFSASRINECTTPTERIRMETLDVLVCLARSLRGRGPLRLRKEDFVGAFKTLPLALAALCMAVAVWGEAAQEGWALQLWCCPFGAVASVYAWERFGSAIQVCVRMRGDGVGRSVRAASAAGDPGSALLRSDGEVRRRPLQH